MARISRSQKLAERAEAALVAAIEAYNKPTAPYREEAFAILCLNAWELLLKAKILADAGNDIRVLRVYEYRQNVDGTVSQKRSVRRNRSGNPHTIGLTEAMKVLGATLPPAVATNLLALTEIRDNAVHFVALSPSLAKSVLEVGTAAVRNYLELSAHWLGRDISRYNLYLLPIGFIDLPAVQASVSGDERRLLQFLSDVSNDQPDSDSSPYNVALEIKVSMHRSGDAALQVGITTAPGAPEVRLSEQNIRDTYPWTYDDLVSRMKERYADFKQDARFHTVRQAVQDDRRFALTRYLDPARPEGIKKRYFNPNILARVFDDHYTRK